MIHALLDTAVKFSQPNSEIMITSEAFEKTIAITISDSGQQIKPQFAGEIFEVNNQSIIREKGSRSAVALSLPFCRAALSAMGGTIHAKTNQTTKLTTFTIQLPFSS